MENENPVFADAKSQSPQSPQSPLTEALGLLTKVLTSEKTPEGDIKNLLESKRTKVAPSDLEDIIDDMIAERKTEVFNKVKSGLKSIIENRAQLAQLEKDFISAKAEKEKELLKKTNSLLEQIEGIEKLRQEYRNALA